MYRVYPVLVAYVAASCLNDGIGLWLGNVRSTFYLHYWFASELFMLALKVFVVWELVRLVFSEYPGIDRANSLRCVDGQRNVRRRNDRC